MSNLEAMNEEFNNFMHKVNQVSNIIRKLNSTDQHEQEMGNIEAKQCLGEEKTIDDAEKCETRVKTDRSVINKKALRLNDDAQTQSQESFMEEMSKDADRRYKDKQVRKEKMETLRKQATLAFRRNDFEKALVLYNKAIELIRDSCILYCNRALTCINLKLYQKAIADCENALRLNENSLRARLLLAQAKFLSGDVEGYRKEVEEAKERHEDDEQFIDNFLKKLEALDDMDDK